MKTLKDIGTENIRMGMWVKPAGFVYPTFLLECSTTHGYVNVFHNLRPASVESFPLDELYVMEDMSDVDLNPVGYGFIEE